MTREIVKALRGAALQDLPSGQRAELRELAVRLESEPDWKAVAVALCIKYAGIKGQALVGSGSMAWARDRTSFRADRDGDALHLHWQAAPFNGLPDEEG